MEESAFNVRYRDLPDIISSWVNEDVDLKGANILDFGCGEGISALGFAARFNLASVVGVDIMPDPANCLARASTHLGLTQLPSNLALKQIQPGENFCPSQKFDVIYSWSVFEHIEQSLLPSVISQLKSKLSDNGRLFIQIAPLYYSSEGSHLFHKVPIPWGHLSIQENVYLSKLSKACDSIQEFEALCSCYQTLNRITVDDLISAIEDADLKIRRKYVTRDSIEPSGQLMRVFNPDVLSTNQVVLLISH